MKVAHEILRLGINDVQLLLILLERGFFLFSFKTAKINNVNIILLKKMGIYIYALVHILFFKNISVEWA